MKKPLRDIIRDESCRRCDLYKRAQAVCLIGDGKYPADIMLVGEAPGEREDEINRPFSGKAGCTILDPVLSKLNIKRSDIFISNVVHCRPQDNRTPTKEEMEICRYYLDLELEHVKPKRILCLGISAAKGLLRRYNLSQKEILGNTIDLSFNWGVAKVGFNYHPAKMFYEPDKKSIFYEYMRDFLVAKNRTDTVVKRWDIMNFMRNYDKEVVIDIETDYFVD